MSDLLQQAVARLTPRQRDKAAQELGFIQNIRNLRHPEGFCDLPSEDLSYALSCLARDEGRAVASDWDRGIGVAGLS